MRFTTTREALVAAVAPAEAVAEKRSTTPILSAVLLRAQGNTLELTSSDKALTYMGSAAVTVAEPGAIAVEAATLLSVVKNLPSGAVVVQLGDNNRVQVSGGSAKFKLNGYDPKDFPAVPDSKPVEGFTFAAAELRRVVDQTLADVAADDNRYGLNGVFLELVGDGRIRFVATDGNRLAWSEAEFTGTGKPPRKMIVPRKALVALRKQMLDGDDGPVEMAFVDRAVVFRRPGVTLHARLMEADFPDYRQVLPSSFKRRVILDRAETIAALRRVSIFATDGARSVKFAFGANGLVMSARKLDAGDSREEVAADIRGEPITLGMNSRFLLDSLAAVAGAKVHLDIGDTLSPIVLRDPEDKRAEFVIMPLRLDM